MRWKTFAAALAIRWAYAVVIFTSMGDAGLQTPDSTTYLFYGQDFAAKLATGALSGFQWLGPASYTMPLSHWLFGLCALTFGASAALAYVLLQGLFDAGTCVLVCGVARTIDVSYAAPAGIAAALNPTQIVLTGLVLTDTPFLFFAALFLLAAVHWLRAPSWRWAALIGLALGAAAMVRALAAPFAAVLLSFLLIMMLVGKFRSRRLIAQLVGAGAIFSLCIAPMLWRNISQFGTWSLSPQTGIYLALWVEPLVKEAKDGTPWSKSYADMQRRVDERYGAPASDPFEQSRRYQTVAREQLATLGIAAAAKAWLTGATINLGSPAATLSPPVMQLPHGGFYATPGATPLDKIANFLFHSDNATYAWIVLTGIAGVTAVRLIQLVGLIALLRQGGQLPALCLFGLWIGYVLAIDGPIASPKYRLPIEAPLMVLAGAGLRVMLRRGRFTSGTLQQH